MKNRLYIRIFYCIDPIIEPANGLVVKRQSTAVAVIVLNHVLTIISVELDNKGLEPLVVVWPVHAKTAADLSYHRHSRPTPSPCRVLLQQCGITLPLAAAPQFQSLKRKPSEPLRRLWGGK